MCTHLTNRTEPGTELSKQHKVRVGYAPQHHRHHPTLPGDPRLTAHTLSRLLPFLMLYYMKSTPFRIIIASIVKIVITNTHLVIVKAHILWDDAGIGHRPTSSQHTHHHILKSCALHKQQASQQASTHTQACKQAHASESDAKTPAGRPVSSSRQSSSCSGNIQMNMLCVQGWSSTQRPTAAAS